MNIGMWRPQGFYNSDSVVGKFWEEIWSSKRIVQNKRERNGWKGKDI